MKLGWILAPLTDGHEFGVVTTSSNSEDIHIHIYIMSNQIFSFPTNELQPGPLLSNIYSVERIHFKHLLVKITSFGADLPKIRPSTLIGQILALEMRDFCLSVTGPVN